MTYDVIEAARRSTRRRAGLLCLVVAILATVTAVGLYFAHGHRSPAARAGADAAPSASAMPVPSGLPGDLTWIEVAGAKLPVSATAGPRDTRDGRARGFAHTQFGAVLAAVHLLVRATPQAGSAVFDPTLKEQVIGPDAASMRDQVGQEYTLMLASGQASDGRPVGRLSATLRGYRMDLYVPTDARLSLLTEAQDATGTPRLAATQIHMQWTGNDWVLVAPAGGNWSTAVLIVDQQQAATFTAFPAGGGR